MKLRFFAVILASLVNFTFASDFESPVMQYHWHNTACYLYANNIGIMLKNNSNAEIGEQAYLLHNNACYLPKGTKPITKFKLTQFYLGKKGHELFFDSGSSPDFRQLKIYDLNQHKLVFVDKYVNGLSFESNNTVEYWQEAPEQNNLALCQDKESMLANGLTPMIVQRVVLDLSDYMQKIYTKKPKCTYVQ